MKQAVGIALIIVTVAILGYLFYKLCAGLCDEIYKQFESK